jgi:hypothetical protein
VPLKEDMIRKGWNRGRLRVVVNEVIDIVRDADLSPSARDAIMRSISSTMVEGLSLGKQEFEHYKKEIL